MSFQFGDGDDDDFELSDEESPKEEKKEEEKPSQRKMSIILPVAEKGESSCPNGHPVERNFNFCPYCSEEILQNKTKFIPLSNIQCSFTTAELLGEGVCGSVFKVRIEKVFNYFISHTFLFF